MNDGTGKTKTWKVTMLVRTYEHVPAQTIIDDMYRWTGEIYESIEVEPVDE